MIDACMQPLRMHATPACSLSSLSLRNMSCTLYMKLTFTAYIKFPFICSCNFLHWFYFFINLDKCIKSAAWFHLYLFLVSVIALFNGWSLLIEVQCLRVCSWNQMCLLVSIQPVFSCRQLWWEGIFLNKFIIMYFNIMTVWYTVYKNEIF